MKLTAKHRVGEVGKQAVCVIQKSRRNSRVIAVDLETGETFGPNFLVSTDTLTNIRQFDTQADVSSSIRVSSRTRQELSEIAEPFQTPDEVIQGLLRRDAAQRQANYDRPM